MIEPGCPSRDNLRDTGMVGTRLWTCQRRGCTGGWSNHLHLSLLFPFKVFSILSREKAPVGRGLTFVPGDIETRIRSITERPSLFPTSQARTSISSPCGLPSLAGEDTGFPRSAPEVFAGLGTCCRPGSTVNHEAAPLNPPPAPVPFGSSLSATLARSRFTVVAQVHMCLPYPLPSHRPACGCQEGRSLAVPAPHACACLCTLSGPLFIQAPRFTRWYGWFLFKQRREQLHIKERHRVAVTRCR